MMFLQFAHTSQQGRGSSEGETLMSPHPCPPPPPSSKHRPLLQRPIPPRLGRTTSPVAGILPTERTGLRVVPSSLYWEDWEVLLRRWSYRGDQTGGLGGSYRGL